jgi:N-methylhydantoinase B/oxoprolinase/acetone carboxylase alpha subunit
VRRISAFLDEYRLDNLETVVHEIQSHSEHAMREAIRALPNGVYENDVWADGLDDPAHLHCRITVHDDSIDIDYAGSDPQRARGGLNCTLIYSQAHTVYPLKCLLSPEVPANEGTFRPFTITAPSGSILNCDVPASVGSRVRTGWHLHALLFGALEKVMPDRVQAGNGLMSSIHVYGQERNGSFYNAHFFTAGGRGASQGRDGIGRNCFPSSARNVPCEVFELRTPVLIQQRSLRPDSAGAGQWRGAFGHQIVFSALPGYTRPLSFFLNPDRLRFPAAGMDGGEDGPCTEIIVNGHLLSIEELGSGQVILESPEDRLELHIPGGGGFGPPERRDPQQLEDDVRSGLVAPEHAALPQAADD